MVDTPPAILELKDFVRFTRPRSSVFLLLSIGLEFLYWLLLLYVLYALYFQRVVIKGFAEQIFGLVILLFIFELLGRLKKRLRVDAPKSLAMVTQAPILYLRSFYYENIDKQMGSLVANARKLPYEKENDDEVLALALRDVAPLLAVGKPSDRIPPLGSIRLYFKDEEWQEQVEKLMSISRLVIIQPGYSSGTEWEYNTARRILPPERIIFSFLAWQYLDEDSRKIEYEMFRRQIKRTFAWELPEQLDGAYFLHFDKKGDWKFARLLGLKLLFFRMLSLPSLIIRPFTNPFSLIASLKKYLTTPRLFRSFSVPGVRETIRPVLKQRGIHMSVWRTAIFVLILICLPAIYLIGLRYFRPLLDYSFIAVGLLALSLLYD